VAVRGGIVAAKADAEALMEMEMREIVAGRTEPVEGMENGGGRVSMSASPRIWRFHGRLIHDLKRERRGDNIGPAAMRNTDIFVPDGMDPAVAISRTTHLGIGAHQDDLEFMAFPGIAECYQSEDKWFGGVVCTDGAGSSRNGWYVDFSDEEMKEVRRGEQKEAARIGKYAFVEQLGYPSVALARPSASPVVDDLAEILSVSRPEVIYTHNPADKHPTHVRVLVAVVEALRRLPAPLRPARLLGCEMWRGLDWLPDGEKVMLDAGGCDGLAERLNAVFDSQIGGGKRYDLGVIGRRRANATLSDARSSDKLAAACYAMDLTPLIGSEPRELLRFAEDRIDRFRREITGLLGENL